MPRRGIMAAILTLLFLKVAFFKSGIIYKSMAFFKYISLPAFLISLAFGLFYVYAVVASDLKTIYIYPTPENVDKILFQDSAKNCFSFQANEVTCPSDSGMIHSIPVQGLDL